jgi:uncharacterized protein YndB with AHSA1/START domain
MPALESSPASVPPLMLEQTRVIRATRASAYQAWTDPEILKQWFGPTGMYCPRVELDVRVGGAYHIEVHPTPQAAADAATPESMSREAAAHGVYTRVVPNELLQFNWIPSWQPGEESLVTVSFKDVDGGTEVAIRHERFSSESSREGHSKGWVGCLAKLAANLERQ